MVEKLSNAHPRANRLERVQAPRNRHLTCWRESKPVCRFQHSVICAAVGFLDAAVGKVLYL